jgi:hypothetical protein
MQRRIADRKPAQRARGRKIVLQERRRDRQHACDVVKPFLIRFVGRQQRARIDFDSKQIANSVRVFGAIQAMDRNTARVRVRRRRRVQLVLQRRRDGAIRAGIRPRTARRRHLAGAQLGDDLFPLLRVVGNVVGVQAIELQSGGLEPAVVTRDTVGPKHVVCRNRTGDRT